MTNDTFVLALLGSLIITLVAYGAFPLLFARTREQIITKRKYRWICYGVNFCILLLFVAANGGAVSGGPYLLWTSIFIASGQKTLQKRGVLEGWQDSHNEEADLKPARPDMSPAWTCLCGRENSPYTSTCVCGKNKRDVLSASPSAKNTDYKCETPIDKDGQSNPVSAAPLAVAVNRSCETLVCPNCNKTQRSDRSVCYHCGSKFIVEEVSVAKELPQIKFCRKCGFKLLDDSAFCSKCGTAITKE